MKIHSQIVKEKVRYFSSDSFEHAGVTLCGWQDVRIQSLTLGA